MPTSTTTDSLADVGDTHNAATEQASIVGRPKHLLGGSYAVVKKVLASEFAKYLALQMVILVPALAYNCIRLWQFCSENTVAPTIFCFVNVDNWSVMILHIATRYRGFLVLQVMIFFLGVLDVASEYIFNHYEVPYSKRRRVFWGVLGLLLLVACVVSIELFSTICGGIIGSIVIYGMVKLVSFITSKVSAARLIVFGNCLVAAVALLLAYFAPYLLGGTPITEYFQRNRMDISQYEKFFAEFDVDISRVFVVGGILSDNAASNAVPFKSMMSIMIGKDTIQNNSFEVVKALMLRDIGHARHFDLLSIIIVPYIIASIGMCFLVKRIGKEKNKSALKHFVTVCAQIALFFLIAEQAYNLIASICVFNAYRFACSYVDLSQNLLNMPENNKALTY
ncbi:uncharacterized protein VICG_00856 [Vittaforma corneae ATCC 50505]|uniref:Uncharacterized protein n=1 Tax=Vittaforma corneae (strain ATCC 50505) TaxID=993615 RepID=L2GMT9_VITCO|nr:uncharacterized protein VICG_00856 [Vittaforma corneae ATCC 50505]ELA42213.1 hypothetical protein VICG_00856 [Vittaforma corneae ATCC 50505]